MPPSRTPPPESPPPMADTVVENLDVIAELHARAQQEAGMHQRAVERLFAAIGRPALLYGALSFTACWVTTNVTMIALGYAPFDERTIEAGVEKMAAILERQVAPFR